MEVCEVLPKLRIFIYLFPNLWNYVKFGQNFQKLFIFAKFMEVCQFLVKFLKIIYFCQIYGIMSSFGKIFKNYLFLSNLWNYVKFCQNLCEVSKYFFFSKAIIVEFIQHNVHGLSN
jgi:hypothetical protein